MRNRALLLLLLGGLAATWVGCQSSETGATSDLTLVTLHVPNMV